MPKNSKKCGFVCDIFGLVSRLDDNSGNPDGPANPNDIEDSVCDLSVLEERILLDWCARSGCNMFFTIASCAARMLSLFLLPVYISL